MGVDVKDFNKLTIVLERNNSKEIGENVCEVILNGVPVYKTDDITYEIAHNKISKVTMSFYVYDIDIKVKDEWGGTVSANEELKKDNDWRTMERARVSGVKNVLL